MNDEELRELLVDLLRSHEIADDAASALALRASKDDALILAMSRHIIGRWIPLRGSVPSTVREPF